MKMAIRKNRAYFQSTFKINLNIMFNKGKTNLLHNTKNKLCSFYC